MHIGSLITDDGEPKRRSIEEFKMIARITFTNMRKLLLQRHKSEDQIESNKMLCIHNNGSKKTLYGVCLKMHGVAVQCT